ncbi:hypothetical protein SO802_008108 [Lithocarpus litseifolius]|uniref:Uncharacterized protein n=1 Tax=Lithocarpus litseifolius TaxID=425828 RepID=A0AAW2DD56_9ROSI
MDERMKQVAENGDITALHQLIGEDVNLLDRVDQVPRVQTPLHIAASTGHIQFAMEMMGLKPSFARKLNLDGFSPIHLALQYGHIELVRRLLQLDEDLVRVKGREWLTPLHYVVESGEHLYLLEEFLLVCPDSITDVTVRNETALHIALKNEKLEAFKFFVGWLANNSSKIAKFNQRRVLNWKENEGNTVLHILVSKNQTDDVRHFLSWCKEFLDVNLKNLEDKTAWDILREDNREIRDMLSHAGAKPGSSLYTFNRYPNPKYQRLPSTVAFRPRDFRSEIREITVEGRNMFLVEFGKIMSKIKRRKWHSSVEDDDDHGGFVIVSGSGSTSSRKKESLQRTVSLK